MTITRVWQSGFEVNPLSREIVVNDVAVIATTAQKKSGSYSLFIPGTNNRYGTVQFPSTYAQMRCSIHFRNHLVSGAETPDVLCFYNTSATPVIRLRYNGTQLQIIIGASTVLVSGTHVPFQTPNMWFHVSMDFKLHASTGWVRVYIDGVQILNFSGNTSGAGTSVDRLILGVITTNQNWTDATYYDDGYVEDTTGEVAVSFAPDYRYDTILIAADGDELDWLGSDGDYTDLYLLIDEVPEDGDATYITSPTPTDQYLGQFNTITLPVGWGIASVIPFAMAKKDSGGSPLGIKFLAKEGGTLVSGATKVLGTDYTYVWERMTSKPTGGAWDQTSLNNVQLGVETT